MTMPRSQVPQLLEASGAHAGRVHDLPYGVHILGRGTDATLQLDHPDVSRRHAQLDVGPEGVIVRDLGSKNGVTIDGHPVVGSVSVVHGQSIALGDLALTLSHPASQVARTLARAGEHTVTSTHTEEAPGEPARGLLWPLLGVALFGGMVVVLLLL